MPFRLKELQASSFRGFADLQLPLDSSLVVISGSNGSGKSSAINCVAWALAGKAIAQKKLGVVEIPERKGWQVVHDGARACQVSLLLQDGTRDLRVKRSSVRDQCEVKGAASGDDPLAALGLTLDTFLSSIFLPQELLRIPVALDPKDRGRIFLDLVGLSGLGELEGTLAGCVKAAKEAADSIARLRKSIDDQVASQLSLKKREIADRREAAKKAGLGPDPDAPDAVERLVRETRGALDQLCERHGAPPPAIPEVRSRADLAAFEKAAREVVARVEAASPDLGKKAGMERRRHAIVGLQEEDNALEADRQGLDRERDALAAIGREEALTGRKTSLEADLVRVKEEIATADAQGALLDGALAYFERLVAGAEPPGKSAPPVACPVCETRPIDPAHVREHLKRSLDRAGVAPLRRKKEESERALRETQEALGRHAQWRVKSEALDRRVEDLTRRVGELRGHPVPATEDLGPVLRAMLGAVLDDLKGVLGRIEERGKDVQRVRDELGRVEVLKRIQEDVGALERLDAVPKEPSYLELARREQGAQVLLRVAEGLRSALKEERRRAFDAAFVAVQDDVVRWFRRITDRPDCRSLRIDSEKWSLLEETGEGEREVTATFNVGDLTSVALAVFLATANRAAHGAGFLLLDDPTQGLDDDHKRRLAGVLAEIADHRQVVVASADEVFVSALEKAGTSSRAVVRLRARAPGRACEVEG
ncbi:MAG: AAA family ATPase [Planctomycetota bacterium]